MAVVWAVTNLKRDVTSKRVHTGTLTATGTYTAGGDTITAAALGLSSIERLDLSQLNDANANPVNLQAIPVKVTDASWKIAVACNVVGAVNTATVAAGKGTALTAAETLTGYTCFFEARGK